MHALLGRRDRAAARRPARPCWSPPTAIRCAPSSSTCSPCRDDDIVGVEIPTGNPLLIELDAPEADRQRATSTRAAPSSCPTCQARRRGRRRPSDLDADAAGDRAGAAPGSARTGDNPAVGCVIAQDGEVVGRGAPRRQAAVRMRRSRRWTPPASGARGATAYVTLEPCGERSPRRGVVRRAAGRGGRRPGGRRLRGLLALRRRAGAGAALRGAGIAVETGSAGGRGRSRSIAAYRAIRKQCVKHAGAHSVGSNRNASGPRPMAALRHGGTPSRRLSQEEVDAICAQARPAVGRQARRRARGVRLDRPVGPRPLAAATSATPTSPAPSLAGCDFAALAARQRQPVRRRPAGRATHRGEPAARRPARRLPARRRPDRRRPVRGRPARGLHRRRRRREGPARARAHAARASEAQGAILAGANLERSKLSGVIAVRPTSPTPS